MIFRRKKTYTPEEQAAHREALCLKLEDGSYKQVRRTLRSVTGYCCLGVASEEYRLATGRGEWTPYDSSTYSFVTWGEKSASYLVPEVQEYYGLKSREGHYHQYKSLGLDNDHSVPFSEIAATIRREFANV